MRFVLKMRSWSRGALALLVLAAAACANGTPTPPPAPVLVPAPPSPTPDPNTLVWAVARPPSTLDSANIGNDAVAAQVAAQVYDRLLEYRPGTTELAPGLAVNWDANIAERSFTFTLREGVKFHDGTPLDAVAVKWNFERWMNPNHEAHFGGEFIAWRAFFGGFIGEKDGERELNLIKDVVALDALTVRITLNAPFAPFLQNIALVPFGFASPGAVAAQGERYGTDGGHLPVGSGAFRVTGWTPDGEVRLEAVRDHWRGAPAVPALRFVVIPEESKRIEAVANGGIHATDLDPTTPITGLLASPSVQVVARPPRSTAWLMLDHGTAPLGDGRVREAIGLAIDREALAKANFGSQSEPAGQLLPPGFMGFDPTLTPKPRDVETAKSFLKSADVAEGFKLVIWAPNEPRPFLPDPVGAANTVAGMLKEIGIDASVRTEGLRQFLSRRDRGEFRAWLMGWEAQSGDPDNSWFWHFAGRRLMAEGRYENPELGASLVDAQQLMVSEQRANIYRAAAQTVISDSARIFLAYTRPLVALSNRVSSYQPNPMGFDNLETLRLEPLPPDATPPPVPTSDPAIRMTSQAATAVAGGTDLADLNAPVSTPAAGAISGTLMSTGTLTTTGGVTGTGVVSATGGVTGTGQ